MISKTCQYAIQGVVYIALNAENGKAIGLKEIADSQDLPTHYLGKILQSLVKRKILKSIKGPNGGFFLTQELNEIKLMDIYNATDGIESLDLCIMGFDTCSGDRPCPMHEGYKNIKADMINFLATKSIEDIYNDIKERKSYISYKPKQ